MGEISNGGGKYHRFMKLLKLSNKDHAIVFRNVGGDNIELQVFVGANKGGPTNGGLIAMGLATNAFDQSFMNKIMNQLNVDITTYQDVIDEPEE